MKQQKNKIIFISAILAVIVLMVVYYVQVVDDDSGETQQLEQPQVPDLEDTQKEYNSKLEAVNDIKEERETTAPSVYPETFIDSTGLYDPDLEEMRRQRIVDSIYRHGRINYSNVTDSSSNSRGRTLPKTATKKTTGTKEVRDFTAAHAAFFASSPHVELPKTPAGTLATDVFIVVEVNGEQTVRAEERLELRLAVDAIVEGQTVPRNTLVFGFVSFQANRVLLNITNIEHRPVNLKAYDLLDGNEGIYIKNSFHADAQREVLDDVVQDINIAGVPQVSGIKQVFRRNNRNVKVTVRNQYQLILKGS
ncbi:hypothetical protein MTsPCn9_10510 [Croceitalea sp. MTPC9]|uniref:conjugative transposon protein TraM n=1 Tax=unclassified Croceitalea TaxID=2632280 RepID=UPI002B38AA86|nr:hypothetical protein MTsPCn6_26730 [Croceitalea sp. MTPC6]GMN16115.1 hypothetical protein MTsPCn9_10510 [Croceitalea sp. MTPC9]